METANRLEKMRCGDYAEMLWANGEFDSLFSSMYWGDSFDSYECFEHLMNSAIDEGVELVDADTWNYDVWFYETYKNDSEKGLS